MSGAPALLEASWMHTLAAPIPRGMGSPVASTPKGPVLRCGAIPESCFPVRIAVSGRLSEQRLAIDDLLLSASAAVQLRARGELDHPFSAQRSGGFTFTLAKSALSDLIDPVVNALPRVLQEATVSGLVAEQGRIDLHDGKKLLEGALFLDGVRLELASENFTVAG